MRRDVKYDDSGDESDFDEEYFERTYRPLSNLPTPPLSSKSSPFQSSQVSPDPATTLDSGLFGPAVHLVNLLPPAASLATPSVPLVQAMLARAKLPLETIALAVCILDSLDSKFARTWRLSCPLASPDNSFSSRRYTLPASPVALKQSHIDFVRPEVIVLCALVIAVKFSQDLEESTRHYAFCWGYDLWTCDQINFTENRIMESLDYRIMPLMDREIIEDAMADMNRAGKYATAQQKATGGFGPESAHARALSTGEARLGLGLQLTPADTPGASEGCGLTTITLAEATQAAFSGPPSITPESLRLPTDQCGAHTPDHLWGNKRHDC